MPQPCTMTVHFLFAEKQTYVDAGGQEFARMRARWSEWLCRALVRAARKSRTMNPPAGVVLPRSLRPTVRNRRAAALPLASLVAHWAVASLHPPLAALGAAPTGTLHGIAVKVS